MKIRAKVLIGLHALAAVCWGGSAPLPPYQLPIGKVPPAAEGVRVEEFLGRPMDLSLTFRDEDGRVVPLASFFQKGRPVIVNLVYYRCPMLCNLILNGLTQVMREIPWPPGK